MLGFMDWSVVAMGCSLILLSLACRWWEQAKIRKGASRNQGMRFYWAWFPLLMGTGMVIAKLPHLLGAPFAVLMIADALNGVLVITGLVLALRAERRAVSGTSEASRG